MCSKGQRPTLTTRHGSTRIVRANTQKSGLFWFPGRYPDSPLLSSDFDSSLSLSLCFSSSFLPYSPIPACSHSLSPSLSFLSCNRAIYPYVRETHRRVERRRGPKMGIESRQPVTSGCVHGTVHREYRYLQTMLQVCIRCKNIFSTNKTKIKTPSVPAWHHDIYIPCCVRREERGR